MREPRVLVGPWYFVRIAFIWFPFVNACKALVVMRETIVRLDYMSNTTCNLMTLQEYTSMSKTPAFKDRLKRARTRADMSQGELARSSGIDRQLLSKYERGASEPRLEACARLAKALKCTTDYLLGMKEAKHESAQGSSDESEPTSVTAEATAQETPQGS